MRIEVFEHKEQLDTRAARLIIDTVRTSERPVLGLATGGTPIGVYRKLVDAYRSGEVSFRHAVTFNLDEYVGLPPGHDQSYAVYMDKHLFSHIDIPREQIHIPDGNHPDPQTECARYDQALAREGRIDVQILGIGHNGHIGFNEPDKALIGKTHVVQLSEQTRQANARFFQSIDEVPRQAITMGIASILQARRIVLLAKGADKAAIVGKALTGPVTTEVPASLLQLHPDLVVLLDREAASELDPSMIASVQ